MKKILVTGANGFIGCEILLRLNKIGYSVRGSVRPESSNQLSLVGYVTVEDINSGTNWKATLFRVEVVIHTAARVHVMNESADDPSSEFRKINVEGTLNLARQAVSANVKRFIFISSIKVNGESTLPGKPFAAEDPPNPVDPYGISKRETEIGLLQLAEESDMEVVIIRPPLVYGPGVKGNFQSMMRWVNRGVPLPLGAIHNKRSLVALDNLVDLIVTCIDHPAATNQIFLAADGEDLSTTDLLRRLGRVLGRPVRLLPCPVWLLIFMASLLGKKSIAQRLCSSLQVDISNARTLLGWEPPISVDEGLRRTAGNFKK